MLTRLPPAVGALLGFVPWIVYWALLGAVPFRLALLIAVAAGVIGPLVQVLRRRRPPEFELGSVAALAALLVLALVVPDSTLVRWVQPLSNGGLLLVAGVLQLAGRPFTVPYARASVDAETAATPGFTWINRLLSGMWCLAFAAMTVVSGVPPVAGVGADSTAAVVCYWVIPFVLLGATGVLCGAFPDWFVSRIGRPVPSGPAGEPPRDGPLPVTLDPVDGPLDGPLVVRAPSAGTATVAVRDHDGRWWSTRCPLPAGGADLRAVLPLLDGPGGVFSTPATAELVVGVESADGRRGRASGSRSSVPPGVRVEDGDALRVFVPSGAGPFPAVVLVPGSEGGLDSRSAEAAWLAGHGVLGAVAATTGVAGRPAELADFPLELVDAALRAVRDRADVDTVIASGISRGAEAVLATALLLRPPVDAVVLISPSDAVWQAVGEDGPIPGTSSWTVGGTPLAFRPVDGEALMPQLLRSALARRPRPLVLRPSYRLPDGGELDAAVLDAAALDVPMLLLAGTDDAVWPAEQMARAVLGRRCDPRDELIVVPGAGHLVGAPGVPVATRTDGIDLGGSPDAGARAQVLLAERTLALARRVGAERISGARISGDAAGAAAPRG